MNHKPFRKAAAAIGITAIALLGAGAPAAFANPNDPYSVGYTTADPTVGINQEAANKALINPLGDVQLSIHKYLGAPINPVDGWGDGTAQTIIDKDPLSGVKFDVYQVFYDAARLNKVDLTTNAGWTAAAAINSYIPTQAEIMAGQFKIGTTTYYLGTATQVTTGPDGTATFTKVDGVGFYLVNENIPESIAIYDESVTPHVQVPTLSVTPTQPFFVTLPKTNPTDTNRWMYDVNVYPKNQSDTATKAVVSQGTNTGELANLDSASSAVFSVTTGITDGLTGPQMGMYVVYDNLDSRLDYTGASVALSGGTTTLTRCDATQTNLATATCDYQVWVGADYGLLSLQGADATVTGGPTVQIVFTDAGLVKLAANSQYSVVTTINTTVNSEGTTGVIPNSATFIPNEGSWAANPGNWPYPETPGTNAQTTNPTTGSPSNTTQLKYGDLIITKQDPAMTAGAADMQGAEFAVYAPVKGTSDCATAVTTPAIATGVIPTTAGIDNTVTIKGLETSDFYLNATQATLQYYCLVETKAPVGYNLNPQPISFTIMQAFDTATPPAPILATFAQTVNNEKANLGNNLPLTGGEGVAALSLGGLVLIGGGAGYYAYTSRKRRTA